MTTRQPFASAFALAVWAAVASAQPADPAESPQGPVAAFPVVELFEASAMVPRATFLPEGCVVVNGIRLRSDLLRNNLTPGRRFTLTPEPGIVVSCVVADARRDSDHTLVTTGVADDAAQGVVIFGTYDGVTAMVLTVPSRHLRYRLHFAGNELYQVWKFDDSALPREARPLPSLPEPPRVLTPDDDDWLPEGGFDPREGGGCTGGTPIIDHMVVYTPAARDAMGGDAAIRAEAVAAVEAANTAYTNSAMATRARLVYCNLISYTEGADQSTDLTRLHDTSDGYMDSVHTTRDAVNADMVILYTNQGSGIGYCPSGTPTYANSPFCTCAWWRAAATYTHAHETGHNLGGGHDVANGGACGPSYGVGHLFTGTNGTGYCTVIAYPDASHSRVLYYSNPNVSYQGTPTGIAIGQPGEAYNARVLTNNDNTMEDFELTRFDIYLDFAWSGAEAGTYLLPFNTMLEGINAISVPSTGAAEIPNLYIHTGTTNWTGTITKAMQVTSCSGPVTIGS